MSGRGQKEKQGFSSHRIGRVCLRKTRPTNPLFLADLVKGTADSFTNKNWLLLVVLRITNYTLDADVFVENRIYIFRWNSYHKNFRFYVCCWLKLSTGLFF